MAEETSILKIWEAIQQPELFTEISKTTYQNSETTLKPKSG